MTKTRPTSGRSASRNIRCMDRAEASWSPIRNAPFQYQASSRPLGLPTIQKCEIERLVESLVRGPDIVRCSVDWNEPCFTIVYLSPSPDAEEEITVKQFSPYSVRNELCSDGITLADEWERFVAQIELLWTTMERQFRIAAQRGLCRIVARCDVPHAQHFTEIAPEAFSLFRIIDWYRGIAEDDNGNRLFSLHAAPSSVPKTVTPKANASLANLESPVCEAPEALGEKEKLSGIRHNIPIGVSAGALDTRALSVLEAARSLGIGRSTLYKLIANNEIKSSKINKRTVIRRMDLEDYLGKL